MLSRYLQFQKEFHFYDVKVNLEHHYKAFMKISELFGSVKLRLFSCFPLRTAFILCYMTLDTKIINRHILMNKTTNSNFWGGSESKQ